jgi:hypothetical protein
VAVFRINLIRDRPVPLPQRQNVATALLIYLLAAGMGLTWAFSQFTRDVLSVRQQSRRVDEMRQAFLSRHPGWPTVEAYAESLRRRMRQADLTLTAAEALMRQRMAVAHVLDSLAAPLPADVRLLNVDFNVAGRALRFDLAVPVEKKAAGADTGAILAAWRNAPMLKRSVADLREQSSQQIEFDGRLVFLLRFEAALREDA